MTRDDALTLRALASLASVQASAKRADHLVPRAEELAARIEEACSACAPEPTPEEEDAIPEEDHEAEGMVVTDVDLLPEPVEEEVDPGMAQLDEWLGRDDWADLISGRVPGAE